MARAALQHGPAETQVRQACRHFDRRELANNKLTGAGVGRVFKYQVMQKAYTKESVLALKKIKAALDTELQAAEASLQHSTTEIHAYERIGAQFNPIVDEYTHIQERIAHVQWALLQLKQQQHPDE